MSIVKKAIFPVAGLGTRFLPATKAIPKEMLPIIDKPLVQYAVEEAINAGIEEIIFVTSHTKRSIEDHFDNNFELEEKLTNSGKNSYINKINPESFENAKFTYVRQKQQKGLGHAVLQAKHLINNEPFAVILADDLIISKKSCIQQMLEIYKATNCSVIGVNKVLDDQVSSYGIVDPFIDNNGTIIINNVIEKPSLEDAPSNLAIVGRYILNSNIFNHLDNQDPGAGNEIQLTDAIMSMLKEESMTACEYEGEHFDCGSKAGYVNATISLALQDDLLSKRVLDFIKTKV